MEELCVPRCGGAGCFFSGFPRPPCESDNDCPPPICGTTVLHVFGAEVVPCSQYEFQLVDLTCADLTDESCYSDPLTIHTAKWGDVWAPLGGESQPNFADIGKVIEKFKQILPPMKVQVWLRDNTPVGGSSINMSDIGRVVDGFKRIAYREVGPSACVEACE